MSESVTLFQRNARLTIAKLRRPLSTAAQNLLAKATEMVECEGAPTVDDAIDTLRLSNDADYAAVAAEGDSTVVIKKAAPDAPSPFEVMTTVAKAMVARGQARTVPDAVDILRVQRHPTYQAWMGRTAPALSPVHKAAPVPTHIQKRQAVQQEINKRAAALVRAGKAENELEALSAIFKSDPALYEEYRQSSYAKGPLFTAAAPAPVAPQGGPAYQEAERRALAMMADDPWGEHAGASKTEMLEKVWSADPGLFTQYRQESYKRS